MSNIIKGFEPKVEYLIRMGRWDDVQEVANQYEAYARLVQPLCYYEKRWDDMAGEMMVCQVHENNSRHDLDADPHAKCLTLDPYPADPRIMEMMQHIDAQMRLAGHLVPFYPKTTTKN